MTIDTIIKRNYTKSTFKPEKITNAILKAMLSVNNGELEDAEQVTIKVENALLGRKESIPNYIPNVEEIQDLVEQKLMQSEFLDVANNEKIAKTATNTAHIDGKTPDGDGNYSLGGIDAIDNFVSKIIMKIEGLGESEVPTSTIGKFIMEGLQYLDTVAYVRYASVYKNFKEAKDFEQFVGSLDEKKS